MRRPTRVLQSQHGRRGARRTPRETRPSVGHSSERVRDVSDPTEGRSQSATTQAELVQEQPKIPTIVADDQLFCIAR